METLQYKIITNKGQYFKYCNELETLVFSEVKDKITEDKIELLTLLIEKYDDEHNTFEDLDPIQIIEGLMANHNMKSKDLAEILGVSKGLVSDIMNYKKGLSKEIIRILSARFSMRQEAFNRPYKLKISNSGFENACVMNTTKQLAFSGR